MLLVINEREIHFAKEESSRHFISFSFCYTRLMSEQTQTSILAIGAIFILIGMFRLIFLNTANPQNVQLTRWMFTGGLIELVKGLYKGTMNLFRFYFDGNAKSTLCIYFGILLFVIVL